MNVPSVVCLFCGNKLVYSQLFLKNIYHSVGLKCWDKIPIDVVMPKVKGLCSAWGRLIGHYWTGWLYVFEDGGDGKAIDECSHKYGPNPEAIDVVEKLKKEMKSNIAS